MLVDWLNFIALVIYSYLTYLIAKETQEIFVSFTLSQEKDSKISFMAVNRTKFEVEVFSKVWAKINNQNFEFKKGFYADNTNMLIQPFMSGGGGFDLKDLENQQGINLDTFVKKNNINSVNFRIQLKYRRVGSKKWGKTSPQQYHYEFKTNRFWWDV